MFRFCLNSKHKSRKVLIIHAHQNCSHAYVCFLHAPYICIPFICFYLALQILPVWFFLVACFSTHCLFCHFTLGRSGLSRFPPPVTWPSVPLCSLKHIALINSLCIYNPSSPCLSCQIVIGYLYTEPGTQTTMNPKQNKNASNKHPNQNKKAREGWNKPFCKLITRQIDYWLLSGCVSSAHALRLDVLGDVHVSSFSNYSSFLSELSLTLSRCSD